MHLYQALQIELNKMRNREDPSFYMISMWNYQDIKKYNINEVINYLKNVDESEVYDIFRVIEVIRDGLSCGLIVHDVYTCEI